MPGNYNQRQSLVGFSNSIFQAAKVTGKSNWSEAMRKGTVPDPGDISKHLENFYSDLNLMAEAGYNTYRFSIEWCEIEPEEGKFNELAILRYRKMFAACKARKMEPMITLLHFVEPYWFTEKGSFEKENNIFYFVRYTRKVFAECSDLVTLWNTINEPGVLAFSGYYYGQFPPHERNFLNLDKAKNVLANLLKAHVAVFEAIRGMPDGRFAEIGLVHNYLKFIPRRDWEPLEAFFTKKLTELTNDIVMTFLSTGRIEHINYYDPMAIESFDYMGLNFYANPVLGMNITNGFGPTCFPGQVLGDMFLPIDPRGFGDAIDKMAALGKPLYITETGIAANDCDSLRIMFLEDFLAVYNEKKASGIDLRGFYYWSFVKNKEWDQGDTKDFGLLQSDRQKRPSTGLFEQFAKAQIQADKKSEEPDNNPEGCRIS
jgi:beta-glucosidase